MLRLCGQVCGVMDKTTAKGKQYKLVKVLEEGQYARITFVQDFRGVTITPGDLVEMEVSVKAYVNKSGAASIAYAAWGAQGEEEKPALSVAQGGVSNEAGSNHRNGSPYAY